MAKIIVMRKQDTFATDINVSYKSAVRIVDEKSEDISLKELIDAKIVIDRLKDLLKHIRCETSNKLILSWIERGLEIINMEDNKFEQPT